MFKIVEVKPLPEYRLQLRYENGAAGIVDLSHLVGRGVFAVWKDPHEFAKARIGEAGELKWGDNIDLCPDALYLEMTHQSPDEVFPNLKAGVNA